jgi:hypothetical protein
VARRLPLLVVMQLRQAGVTDQRGEKPHLLLLLLLLLQSLCSYYVSELYVCARITDSQFQCQRQGWQQR